MGDESKSDADDADSHGMATMSQGELSHSKTASKKRKKVGERREDSQL